MSKEDEGDLGFVLFARGPCFFSAINPRGFSHEKHEHVHKFEKFIRNYHNRDVLEKTAFKVLQLKNDVNLNNKNSLERKEFRLDLFKLDYSFELHFIWI